MVLYLNASPQGWGRNETMFTVTSCDGTTTEFATIEEARRAVPKGAKGWRILSPNGRGVKIPKGKRPHVKLPGECDICGGLKGAMGALEANLQGDNDAICDCD